MGTTPIKITQTNKIKETPTQEEKGEERANEEQTVNPSRGEKEIIIERQGERKGKRVTREREEK